jgi:transposase
VTPRSPTDPPGPSRCRALLETYHDLRAGHTAWVQRIHAVLFHQGAPALGEGTLRTEQGVAAPRAVSAAHLSPAGQLQVATAPEVIEALEGRLHVLRHQLLDAARHLTGAKVLAARRRCAGAARPYDPPARSQNPAAIRDRDQTQACPDQG